MADARNLVVYEITFNARDDSSGKRISNSLYARPNVLGLNYGDVIPGSTNTGLLDAVWTVWLANVIPLLNENYISVSQTIVALTGRRFPTPYIPLVGVTPLLTATRIITGVPHGFSNGQTVEILGATGSPGLDGMYSNIAVVSPTAFDVNVVGIAASGGPGAVQRVEGYMDWFTQDRAETVFTNAGGVTGDMMPLYATVSMRRINEGTGRNFRSRLSISPISEADQVNGRLTGGALAAWNLAGGALQLSYGMETEDAEPVAVSKQLAFAGPVAFTQSFTWAKDVSAMPVQPNLGTLVKRKPRLTAGIS